MAKLCPVCGISYPDTSSFCATDGTTLISEGRGNDLVGSVVADRYLVERLLGEGGMGRVYLAKHVRLPQAAAIKVLHPGMIADPEAVARFNREAANAARIEHDRVARVFDFGETREGSVYLAMEYVPGRSLHALVAEQGRLPAARAARIVFQVAEGLEAAHRIGIVHRDLKPDNIMVVTDEQGGDRCKVVDFGIAKAADGPSRTRLTRTGMVVGTPEFMSPEQFLGEELDARSDVYALALVAYNALTGAMPFVASTPERAMAARMIEAPRSLAAAVPEEAWPPALQDVFDRALDRDPATRTATAMEFGEALVAAVEAWTGEQVLRSRTPLSTRGVTPSSAMPLTAESPRPGATMEAPRAATPAATPAAVGATESAPPRKASRVPLFLAGVLVVGVAGYFAVMSGRPEAGAGGEAPGAVPVATGDTVRGDSAVGTPAAPATTSQRRAPAAPASGETVVAPPVAPPPAKAPDAALSAVTPRGAITSLDSIQNVLRDDASGEDEARAAIPVLDRLLREMANATDSTWTYLALANAHGQAGSPSTRACNALRSADRLATTVRQRTVVASLFESPAFSCVR